MNIKCLNIIKYKDKFMYLLENNNNNYYYIIFQYIFNYIYSFSSIKIVCEKSRLSFALV